MNNDRETALRSALPDDEHERLRGLIPEYIVARLRETPLSAAWGEFEAHLASCADCQNELEELSQLLSDTAAGNLPAATFYPELDMSYLSILSQSDPSDSSQVAPLSWRPFEHRIRQVASAGLCMARINTLNSTPMTSISRLTFRRRVAMVCAAACW